MDGFTYYNLFETKGIEYIIIIAFLLLIIPFWILINRPIKLTGKISRTFNTLSSSILRIPQGVFFSDNHTWAHLGKAGNARVGIDDLLLHLTGPVTVRMVNIPGAIVSKGDVISEIDHEGKKLRIASPISGEITRVNHILHDDPAIMQEDPYGQGWLLSIKPSDWVSETNRYHFAREATAWLGKELDRFKDFLALSVNKHSADVSPVYMQDGGEMLDNPLSSMPVEVWQEFEKEFLR
jgi:glycine cleavage system H protein